METKKEHTVTITTFPGLLAMAHDSKGRNREIDPKKLMEHLDKTKLAVQEFSMIHNDCEMRSLWLVGTKDNKMNRLIVDCSFEVYNEAVMRFSAKSQTALKNKVKKEFQGK